MTLLITDVRDNIGTIRFNRPERKNALSPEMLHEIRSTLAVWKGDRAVRAVVITGGTEGLFSAGFDIAALPAGASYSDSMSLREANPLEQVLQSVKQHPCPVIAMISGYCFGAALNLAICCDMRIGATDIKAGMPPAKLGLVYPPAGIRQFADVIGLPRVRELFFTGRTYRGEEAARMGLVDHLVAPMDLQKVVYGYAAEIAANAPLAVNGIKRVINMTETGRPLEEVEQEEAERLILKALESNDLKEGQTAFFERRKPKFSGC